MLLSSAASFDEASDLNDAPSACSFDSLQQDGGVGWGRARWRALVRGWVRHRVVPVRTVGHRPFRARISPQNASGGDGGGDGGGDRLMRRGTRRRVGCCVTQKPGGLVLGQHRHAGERANSATAMLMRAPARLVFPGGGIFFWWQAGAIASLSKRIDLSTVPCCGASAGSATRNSNPAPVVQARCTAPDPQTQVPKRPLKAQPVDLVRTRGCTRGHPRRVRR